MQKSNYVFTLAEKAVMQTAAEFRYAPSWKGIVFPANTAEFHGGWLDCVIDAIIERREK